MLAHSQKQLSAFNGCLVVYEWFGLQFFSYKASLKENFKDSIPISKKIYFAILFAILLMLGCISFVSLALTEVVTSKNVLTQLYSQSIILVSYFTIWTGLVQAYTSTKYIKKIFSNTEVVVESCRRQLKVTLSFGRFRTSSWKRFCGMAFVIALAYAAFLAVATISGVDFLISTVALLTLGSFSVILINKFVFYVCLINFELEFVNTLLQSVINLCTLKLYTLNVKNSSNCSRQVLAKLQAVWEVYEKVRENAILVNKSMGVTMLFSLMNIVMALVYCGYGFCTASMGGSNVALKGIRKCHVIKGKSNYKNYFLFQTIYSLVYLVSCA